MRIDGTYMFPATLSRVYAALLDAEALARVIPGCERLTQMGPEGPEGVAFECRLRMDAGAGSITWRAAPARRPTSVRLAFHGRLPAGPFAGKGVIDLVEQEEHTLGAYALELDAPNLAVRQGQQIARELCELLGDYLLGAAPDEVAAPAPVAAHASSGPRIMPQQVRTPRGRIVALPRLADMGDPPAPSAYWAQRALWMGAGMLLGISAIALALAVVRRLADHDA